MYPPRNEHLAEFLKPTYQSLGPHCRCRSQKLRKRAETVYQPQVPDICRLIHFNDMGLIHDRLAAFEIHEDLRINQNVLRMVKINDDSSSKTTQIRDRCSYNLNAVSYPPDIRGFTMRATCSSVNKFTAPLVNHDMATAGILEMRRKLPGPWSVTGEISKFQGIRHKTFPRTVAFKARLHHRKSQRSSQQELI